MTNPQPSSTGLPRPYPTVTPPPAGGLALAYFKPLMSPVPVATRWPQQSATADTINGFLRVEASGGTMRPDGLLFDVGIILHAYAPNAQESMAEQVMAAALAWGNNAAGTWITHPSTQIPYFIAYSRSTGLGVKQQDPLVNLTRFVGKINWWTQGYYVSS